MADDRMKDDDLQRNMGRTGEGQDFGKGQQTPGRNPQDDQQTGGQQRGGQTRIHDDDDFDAGKQPGTPKSWRPESLIQTLFFSALSTEAISVLIFFAQVTGAVCRSRKSPAPVPCRCSYLILLQTTISTD